MPRPSRSLDLWHPAELAFLPRTTIQLLRYRSALLTPQLRLRTSRLFVPFATAQRHAHDDHPGAARKPCWDQLEPGADRNVVGQPGHRASTEIKKRPGKPWKFLSQRSTMSSQSRTWEALSPGLCVIG